MLNTTAVHPIALTGPTIEANIIVLIPLLIETPCMWFVDRFFKIVFKFISINIRVI